jgi:HPt (histidine-containing phosphotransfer) domain-containing protein/CheY-like chemotaxis protein
MKQLRVLLVRNELRGSERISSVLEGASHAVLELDGLTEAWEALEVQKFDAILVSSSLPCDELESFKLRLREIEKVQRTPVRTPILSCLGATQDSSSVMSGHTPSLDGYLPHQFEPSAFVNTVTSLANCACQSTVDQAGGTPEPSSVFDPDGFREQLAHDQELIVEIVNLFLEESNTQLSEMRDALASGDFSTLRRITHTLKGSLGSLHAAQSRVRAQELEASAKESDGAGCQRTFMQLESDLEALRPHLVSLLEP